ncbi:MAG: 30S ribosomal protein S3 [Nanoarchaeota archaeon]
MIERKIVSDNLTEQMIGEYIASTLDRVGYSHTELHKTPMGEKIIIHSSRPGLIVGSKGSNIKKLTKLIKVKFKLENPQIEVEEITQPDLDPMLVAESIASRLERFGPSGFKGAGYRSMENAIRAGALGIEILISGKIPSSRSRVWRFYQGYLKKCGDVALSGVKTAYTAAQIKSGSVGIQVRIMPPDMELPDKVTLSKELIKEESQGAPEKSAEKALSQTSPKKQDEHEKVEVEISGGQTSTPEDKPDEDAAEADAEASPEAASEKSPEAEESSDKEKKEE